MTAPLQFLSPSVKVREIDLSAYTKGPGATALGLLGVFEKGPIATPTVVNSFAEAQRIFGAYLQSYYSMHSLRHFFDQGGQQAVVVRTAHYTDPADSATLTAVKATLTLVDRAGTPLSTLRVDALSHGAWGNGATGGLSVQVADAVIDGATKFRLVVFLNSQIVEEHEELSMLSTSDDYVVNRIAVGSQYVTVTDLASATAAPNNRPAVVGETDLASGADGLGSLDDTDFIGNVNAKTGLYAFDSTKLISLLAVPGRTGYTMAAEIETYCTNRKDVFGLLETPSGVTVVNAVAYRNQTTPYSGAAFDSSYIGLWYPWLKFLDPVTRVPRLFPPTGVVAGIIARAHGIANRWGVAAGYQRGVIRQCLGLETDVTEAEANTLHPVSVNPIVRKEGTGFVLFGQNTLQRRTTATDRMNVRFMLMLVETTLKTFAESLLFEPHTPQTWNAFKRFANPFLGRIKDQQGLVDYQVICDETNNPPEEIDQNRLNITVFVKPTKTAEYITINIVITSQGANFEELFGRV